MTPIALALVCQLSLAAEPSTDKSTGSVYTLTQGAFATQPEVLLDEANPDYGIPAKAYADFKGRIIHVATTTQIITGDAYEAAVTPGYKKLKLDGDKEVQWAIAETHLNSKVARDRLLRRGANLFVKNASDIVHDNVASSIFPVQKEFATWAGDTRVWRVGKP